jgi:succinate dehydrogenase hydrophobic anchor subunit
MRKSTKRWLSAAAILLVAAWICFVSFIAWAMRQPPEVFGNVMKSMPMPAYFLFPFETMWVHARSGVVQPGDIAPDFTVKTLNENTPVQLASLWARQPVVLVFGSYT